MSLFPWQQAVWQQLFQRPQHIPHTLLLVGPAGIGKAQFGKYLAQALLCLAPDANHRPCQQCQSCLWFQNQNHPDMHYIRPIDDQDTESETSAKTATKRSGGQILIEQIRQLDHIVYQTTYMNHHRVVLVDPLDQLHPNAAHAFLKKLEEPLPQTKYILVSARKNLLLPTILSRCHCLCPGIPTQQQAIDWLKQQQVDDAEQWLARAQSPLVALQLARTNQDDSAELIQALIQYQQQGPLYLAEWAEKKISSKKQYYAPDQFVCCIQKIGYDLICLKQNLDLIYHPDLEPNLQKLGQKTDLDSLMVYEQQLIAYRKEATHPLNLRLFVEQILLNCPFI